MRVKVVPLREPAKVKRCLAACRPLWDRACVGLRPNEFWRPGTYHPGPRFVNCWLIILRPPPEALRELDGPVGLGREVAHLLEERHDVVLDWCAGALGGDVRLFTKSRASSRATGKEVRFRLNGEDIAALAALLGRGGGRRRREQRERERSR